MKKRERKAPIFKYRKNRQKNKSLNNLNFTILSNLVKTHSLSEIGDMFGFSRVSIYGKVKKLGIKIPKKEIGRFAKIKGKIKYKCFYYPCHEIVGDCRWCYCPLYTYNCGGNYTILKNGIKDCSKCFLPHDPKKGYDFVIKKLSSL